MAAKTSTVRSFLKWYSSTMPLREAAAVEIGNWMKERVSDLGIAVDSISARAKDLRSTRSKLREKRYKNPRIEMTDMIGVRTVLLFETEIETATTYLRNALTISDRYSRSAGKELALAEFGYRSVHLIARFRGRTMPSYARIGRPSGRSPSAKLIAACVGRNRARSSLQRGSCLSKRGQAAFLRSSGKS